MDHGWQDLSDRRRAIERERESGPVAAGAIRDDIRASWARCQPLLEVEQRQVPVDESVVAGSWDESPIRRQAADIVTQLADTAQAAGMLAAVTDPVGRVLWRVTPSELRRGAEAIGLVPGGRWDEPVAGTNGIGMALVTRQPVFVFADEALVQSGAGLGLLLGPRTHADR